MPRWPVLPAFAALVALSSGAAVASDVPEPPALPPRLDLDTALRLLRERGLDVLAAEAAVQGAEGDLRAAAAIANPTLSGSYGRSFRFGTCVDASGNAVACTPLPDPAIGVGLSDNGALLDVFIGKRGLRRDVARAALAAARLQRDDALRTLAAQVGQAFVQVLVARDTLAFDVDVAAAQSRTADLSRARLENGAISEADLARIETAWLEAEQAVDGARADLRTAQVTLAFLLGVRSAVPDFDVVGGVLETSAAPPGLAGQTRESVLERALASRTDLLAARRQLEQRQAALALARRQRMPDVSLSLDYSQQGTTNLAQSPPTFTVGLSLPLPLFYHQRGEIERADADRRTQALAVAKAEATVVLDLESAWGGYAAARARVDRMEKGLLERARTARDLVTVQYQKGAASLLDLLDAERTFIAVRVEYLQDLGAYWSAVFKLEQAAGVALR